MMLLGLLSDFWAHWIPSTRKRDRKASQLVTEYMLPKRVCKEISRKADYVLLTEYFKKPYRDIIKCAIRMHA